MLIPLAIGRLIKSHSPDVAAEYQPVLNKVASISLLRLLVTVLGVWRLPRRLPQRPIQRYAGRRAGLKLLMRGLQGVF
jgi:hypothetical protein